MAELVHTLRPNLQYLGSPGVAGSNTLFDLKLQLITPMFGGSDHAGHIDLERPVTAKSIRGHLRFWWRACRAGNYGTVKELYDAESLIFGRSAWYDGNHKGHGASPVQVEVTGVAPGNLEVWAQYAQAENGTWRLQVEDWAKPLQYVLFPFQGKTSIDGYTVVIEPSQCLKTLSFRLKLSSSSLDDQRTRELGRALWAWLFFGGIGARTRRGLGSLRVNKSTVEMPSLDNFLSDLQSDKGQFPPVKGVPSLSGARILVGKSPKEPNLAAADAISLLQHFRQGEGLGRRGGSDPRKPLKLGRSFWPEPDTIRIASKKRAKTHGPLGQGEPYYPRADLGLPIIFHFIGYDEPKDHNLQGEAGLSRMASPFILKASPSSNSVPIVCLLNTPHVWDDIAPKLNHDSGSVSKNLLKPEAAKANRIKPLTVDGKCFDNARDAFLAYAASELGATPKEI